jgi:hypothetical protein
MLIIIPVETTIIITRSPVRSDGLQKTMYAAINATIEIIVAAVTIREGVLSSVYNQTVLKLIISIMDK